MIFTAYLDESNTDGPRPDMTMGGFVGSGRQWELLERRLRRLQRRDHFGVFHASDFKARKNDFHGWSDEKCSQLIGDFAVAVRDELTEGVTVSLSYRQYREEYKDLPFPKGMRQLSQFGLCFQTSLNYLIQTVLKINGKHRLHIVVEDGHPNVGAASAIFSDAKKSLKRNGIDVLGTVTRALKSECEPLMIADFQAHLGGLNDIRTRAGLPSYAQMTNKAPRSNEAGITFLHWELGALQRLKDNFARERDAFHAEAEAAHFKRKAAWLASKATG